MSSEGNLLLGSLLPDDPLLENVLLNIENESLLGEKTSRFDSAFSDPLSEEVKPLQTEDKGDCFFKNHRSSVGSIFNNRH